VSHRENAVTQLMLISLLTKSMATKMNDNQLWPDDYQNQLAQVREILNGLPNSIR
jgi:hypothetical protein